jgi:hypothetical protein
MRLTPTQKSALFDLASLMVIRGSQGGSYGRSTDRSLIHKGLVFRAARRGMIITPFGLEVAKEIGLPQRIIDMHGGSLEVFMYPAEYTELLREGPMTVGRLAEMLLSYPNQGERVLVTLADTRICQVSGITSLPDIKSLRIDLDKPLGDIKNKDLTVAKKHLRAALESLSKL